MDDGCNGLSAKRQRRSHHQERPLEFCHCARCKGEIKQKATTISDHRTRYPHPVEPAAISPSVEMDHTIIIPEVIGIEQQSERDLSYPRSPTPEDNMDHQIPALQAGSPEANVDPNLLAVAEELEHEYRFDQLIGDPGDHFADLEGHIAENLFDDIDFGLPDDYGPAIDALPHFHLPDDLEPEESDNEVEAVDNPDIFCAAFQEPDLIRNAYIDAFVQKTLSLVWHRLLRQWNAD
ncbi:unnamed protein product [Rhizoctonia solani]|uniref:Uncharacterized protein n=1 Tax=Rhizoctonia solani TaxID=456999 RepID=A0A8H2X6K7_9AGAM|nr:unnamed protein product [Rhizoctonia solani]